MKRIIIYIFSSVLLFGCSSVNRTDASGKRIPLPVKSKIYSSWSFYSAGLYYKFSGDYIKAIKNFMDAATFREEQDKVYYQLAECYYYTGNFENSINYSSMAIKENKEYSKPYLLLNRIYLERNDNKKAVEILEALTAIRPEMINIHYSIGLIYYNRIKDYDKAAVSFRNIQELSAGVPIEDYYKENSYYYLARIYYSKDLFDRAIENLLKVTEINPDNKTAMYLLANIYMELYQFEETKKISLQYNDRFGDNTIINANLGRIFYIENDPKCIEYLKSGISSEEIYGDLCRALYYERMSRDKEAEPLLSKLISTNKLLVTPHIALGKIALRKGDNKTAASEFFTAGVILYKAGQFNASRAQLTEVLLVNDTIPEVYFYIGKIYEETQKMNLSIVNYKKANKLRPSMEMQIHIGYLYSQINDFENAGKYLDTAIKMEPNDPKPYFYKGLALSRKNEFAEAEKLIKKAIEIKTDDTYYFYLATVQEKQNKIDDTIKSLRKAIEFNPKNAMVYNYLGYLFAEMNTNLDESIELIQKALEISPLNGAYLDSLGWAYYKKGDVKQALKKLLQAEKRLDKDKSPDPVVYDHIGDTYKEMGESDKAVEYWKKSVNLQKNPKIEEKMKNPGLK